MRFFKILSIDGWQDSNIVDLKKGSVYPENHRPYNDSTLTLGDMAEWYPQDFEEVESMKVIIIIKKIKFLE